SALGRSIAYTLELWPGLVRFLENPDISLHNNGAERAMRGVVLGVSLCSTSSSPWNRKGAVIASRSTRALDRAAVRELALHRGRLQIFHADLPWSIRHHLLCRQRTGLDQAVDDVIRYAQRLGS